MLSIVRAGDEIDSITIKHSTATIGRNSDNTVELEDSRRYISGHHASIDYRAPDYYITDMSTNGVLINNAILPVGNGNSIKLSDGDHLHIGDYTLIVRIDGKQQQVGLSSGSLTDEALNFSDDPFAELDTDLVQKMIDENQLMPEQESDSSSFNSFDFLGSDKINPSLIEEDNEKKSKIEQLPPVVKEAFQPFKPEKKEKKSAVVDDIFADDWFKENQGEDSRSEALFPADFFSKKEPIIEISPEIKLSVDLPEKPVDFENPVNSSDFQTLIVDNFLRGAGLEKANIYESITPESFYIIGKILKASIQGTMDVLIGRAKIKNEMHLDVTTIKPIENNPVKFSVTAEEALRKLMAPQDAGYLQAEEAIEEAFDDIRAHQISVISGMQTALLEVLKRFDPQKIEQRLQQQSPLSASIPIHKQAKLWRLFESLYDDIEREASDNFYHLFGEAFAETYEQQMIELKNSKK